MHQNECEEQSVILAIPIPCRYLDNIQFLQLLHVMSLLFRYFSYLLMHIYSCIRAFFFTIRQRLQSGNRKLMFKKTIGQRTFFRF